MRFSLLPFQVTTVERAVTELRLSMDEVGRVGLGGNGQAVTLAAPTGAGKTVMAAAVLEALFWGDEQALGDDQLTVVWLSDLPNVNEQTRRKIARASDRLTEDRLVQVDNNFRDDELAPGRVYFLNTQKLSVNAGLVATGDDRNSTIWEVLTRTIARAPSRFLLVIDEAHRGMDRPTGTAAQTAASIVQRFILGSDEMTRSPIILGISATPTRFDNLVAGANRTIRRADADIAEVRSSGLIKERIVVWRPEHGLVHSELTLLQRAAQSLHDYQLRWTRYCDEQSLPKVVPILVVQVEDKTGDAVTATDLAQAIDAIEEVTGHLHPDSYAHCFGDAPAPVIVGSRRIRYLRPADIDSDPQVTVVFFKTSLSTGWDCPRAEVIMSFRTAREPDFIAQLVGRMVRTPLARRVDSDEVLNSVGLYLPKYDRGAVQAIVRQLRSGDPDFVPPIEVDEGDGLVSCDRRTDLFDRVTETAKSVRSYVVPRRRRMAPVARLERLAGCLSDFELHADAPTEMEAALVDILWSRLSARRSDRDFERAIEQSKKIGLNATTLSYLTGETETLSIQVESTSRSLERLYEQVGLKVGAGLHTKLWRKIRVEDPTISGDVARLYVIATLGESATLRALDNEARQQFEEWVGRFSDEIDELAEAERQEFDQLLEHAEAPTDRAMSLPTTVRARRTERSIDYPRNLYQDEDGEYPDTFNDWEKDVVETELGRDGAITWVRNKPRQSWALTIPYDGPTGDAEAMYPDFLFFRQVGDKVVVDLVDPHGVHIPDAPAKARGLARYAKKHGHLFNRLEMVIYDRTDGRRQTLNLKSVSVRDHVLAVTTQQHLHALFDLAGS